MHSLCRWCPFLIILLQVQLHFFSQFQDNKGGGDTEQNHSCWHTRTTFFEKVMLDKIQKETLLWDKQNWLLATEKKKKNEPCQFTTNSMSRRHGGRIQVDRSGGPKDSGIHTEKWVLGEERSINVSGHHRAESLGETFHEEMPEHPLKHWGYTTTIKKKIIECVQMTRHSAPRFKHCISFNHHKYFIKQGWHLIL